ncbi:FK506 binding protein [Fragilaria crotonensis]|nr:FK506 binding protein [Fragilaria crotonensis]
MSYNSSSSSSSNDAENSMPNWHALFCQSDDDSSDADDLPIFVPDHIHEVHVAESADYRGEIVQLTIPDGDGSSSISSHAPTVRMSGCGASVDLLQPNHSNNIEGTGGVVWGCAPAMCTVLSGSSCYTSTTPTIETVAFAASHALAVSPEIDFSNQVILELGAGTGALGLWIATKWPTATVLLTDLPETLNLLQDNIKANKLESRCFASELAFGDTVPSFLAKLKLQDCVVGFKGVIHAIVASDCQFSASAEFLWQPFASTLRSADPLTRVWISLQERHGVRKERLEPFLNALRDLAGRGRHLLQPEVSESEQITGGTCDEGNCSFAELFHPGLGEGSQNYNAEYPNRCFYLAL